MYACVCIYMAKRPGTRKGQYKDMKSSIWEVVEFWIRFFLSFLLTVTEIIK